MAHNCHIKTKCSQKIQITHNKFKTLTANSNHSQQITNRLQQIQITYSKLQLVVPAWRLQSPTASGARRLKIFVMHEAATLESSPPLFGRLLLELNEREPYFVFTVGLPLLKVPVTAPAVNKVSCPLPF